MTDSAPKTRLSEAVAPATPEHLTRGHIHLWHGASWSAVPGILARGRLRGGPRSSPGELAQVTRSPSHAAQYPEDAGADALVLVRADPRKLSVDPHDQIGRSVEDGLFGATYGSSATLPADHDVAAVFDLRDASHPDEAIARLEAGDLPGALDLGVRLHHVGPGYEHP